MWTFNEVAKFYASERKYKGIGVKVWNDCWLDKVDDHYVVKYVVSKRGYNDEKAAWVQLTRPNYVTEDFIEIHDGYTKLIVAKRFDRIPQTINSYLSQRFGVSFYKPAGKQIKGWQLARTPSHVMVGVTFASWITLDMKGNALDFDAPLIRGVDKEKSLELNRHIKWARRMLGLRDRLGAIASMNMQEEFGKIGRPYVLINSPERLYKDLMKIDEENIHSLIPILFCAYYNTSFYARMDLGDRSGANPSATWLELFNRLIACKKDALRIYLGAVTYERDEQKEQAPQAA